VEGVAADDPNFSRRNRHHNKQFNRERGVSEG
jgi:hypothetical protein